MAEVSKSRLALDIEEIERQLRRSASQGEPSKSDPLAELARIVGQDDPFHALLAGDRPASRRPTGADDIFARREPLFDAPHHGQTGAGAYALRGSLADEEANASYGYQPVALTAEEEALLHGHHYPAGAHDSGHYYDDEPGYGEAESAYAPVRPRRSRKGLLAAGAVLAAGALATVVVLALGPGTPAGDGNPPVVKADAGPLKLPPQNPGGIDIPNQNKNIYEPVAQDTQTRVVNREEQPIDIRQAIRSGGPENGGGAGPVRLSPAAPSNAIASNGAASLQGSNASITGLLGEPRRVRTVSIRPDGTVLPGEPHAAQRPAAPATMSLPEAPRPSPSTTMPTQGPQGSVQPPRPRDMALPPAPQAGPGATRAEPQAGAPLQITPDAARSRVAATPSAVMREPTETSAAPSASPGFSVQLGVRNTEREARQAFDQFQQRYAGDLSGFSPLILQAEINGKTAYRVRVGPLSRDDATSLCTRLKTSGGQCFVANN
jgi:SPOR domain